MWLFELSVQFFTFKFAFLLYMIKCVQLSANLLISRPSSNPSSRTWRVRPAFIPIPRPRRPPKAASNRRPRSRYSSVYPSPSRAVWSRFLTFPIYRWECHLGETKPRVISSALKLLHNTVHSHTYSLPIVLKKIIVLNTLLCNAPITLFCFHLMTSEQKPRCFLF